MAGRGCCSRCSTAQAAAGRSRTAGAARTSCDALDLCLACKGCKADCPVNVDMATYKAEFLFHHFKRRLRPLAHYSMGWLPLWSALAAHAPRLVNALLAAPGLGKLAIRAAGIDEHRVAPAFARQSFQDWFASREPGGTGERGEVLLWPDTFSNHFHPSVAQAAVEVLEDAGWRVIAPSEPVCCGLTWISTGQLDTAKQVLRRTLDVLRPHLRAGTRVLGLEPSCTAVFRADATELFPDDADVEKLRRQTVTLAELLRDHTPGWAPPRLDRTVHVQTHCHHHAIMGYTADRQLLTDLGAQVDVLDSGCCGLAGNFGFEKGHYEVSEACAERVLLPAVRAADDADVILADGFSCRTQIEQGDIRWPRRRPPRRAAARRTARRRRRDTARAAVGAAAGALVTGRAARRRRRRCGRHRCARRSGRTPAGADPTVTTTPVDDLLPAAVGPGVRVEAVDTGVRRFPTPVTGAWSAMVRACRNLGTRSRPGRATQAPPRRPRRAPPSP